MSDSRDYETICGEITRCLNMESAAMKIVHVRCARWFRENEVRPTPEQFLGMVEELAQNCGIQEIRDKVERFVELLPLDIQAEMHVAGVTNSVGPERWIQVKEHDD